MSSSEFLEWQAFYSEEPFGESRGDLHAALVATTLANAHRNPEKRRKPFGLDDFLPRYWERAEDAEQRSGQSLLAKVAMLNAALGGVDERKK